MEFTRENSSYVHRNEKNEIDAQIDFNVLNDQLMEIAHTFVHPSLRGQGIAKKLVDRVVLDARMKKMKILPSCSYVYNLFQCEEQYADVYEKEERN